MSPDYYWHLDKAAPFATLLSVVSNYCHPEAYDEAYDDLTWRARQSEPDDEMRRFKDELRRGLLGDLPPDDDLFVAACYDDGSDEAFLRRLWRDLYPDEPLPQP